MIKTTLKFNAGIPYYRRLVIGYLADNKIKILKIKSGFIHSKITCLFDSYDHLISALSDLNIHSYDVIFASKIKELKEKQWKKYQDIG